MYQYRARNDSRINQWKCYIWQRKLIATKGKRLRTCALMSPQRYERVPNLFIYFFTPWQLNQITMKWKISIDLRHKTQSLPMTQFVYIPLLQFGCIWVLWNYSFQLNKMEPVTQGQYLISSTIDLGCLNWSPWPGGHSLRVMPWFGCFGLAWGDANGHIGKQTFVT